jgi:hypothetical protein
MCVDCIDMYVGVWLKKIFLTKKKKKKKKKKGLVSFILTRFFSDVLLSIKVLL